MTHQILMPSAWITPALLQHGAQSGGGVIGAPSTGATLPAASGAPAGADGTAAQPGGSNIFFFFIIMTVGMLLIMSLSGRKEKKKRAQMLAALGKKDKVRTAGGIIGTVIEIKDDEVLLETDRASHTRLWLTRASISSIIKQSSAPSEDTNEPVTEKNA